MQTFIAEDHNWRGAIIVLDKEKGEIAGHLSIQPEPGDQIWLSFKDNPPYRAEFTSIYGKYGDQFFGTVRRVVEPEGI